MKGLQGIQLFAKHFRNRMQMQMWIFSYFQKSEKQVTSTWQRMRWTTPVKCEWMRWPVIWDLGGRSDYDLVEQLCDHHLVGWSTSAVFQVHDSIQGCREEAWMTGMNAISVDWATRWMTPSKEVGRRDSSVSLFATSPSSFFSTEDLDGGRRDSTVAFS